jgi:hypothetical protein
VVLPLRGSAAYSKRRRLRHPGGNDASALGGQALKWQNGTRGVALLKPWQLVEHDESFEVQDPATSDQVRKAIRRLVELGPRSEEMIATSHGRRSWKDSPKAKRIAVTIALLLIAMLAVAFLFTQ